MNRRQLASSIVVALVAMLFAVSVQLTFSPQIIFRDDFATEHVALSWVRTVGFGAVNQSGGVLTLESLSHGSDRPSEVLISSEILFTSDRFFVSYRVMPAVLPRRGVCGLVGAVTGFTVGITYVKEGWYWSYWEPAARDWRATAIRAVEGIWYVVRWTVSPTQVMITVWDDDSGMELGSHSVSLVTRQTSRLTLGTFAWGEGNCSASWDYVEIRIDPRGYQWIFLAMASMLLVVDITVLVHWSKRKPSRY